MEDEKRKVLVIDDEDDIREVLSLILTKEGYEVLTSPDGEKAVDIIRKNDIGLVLCDLNLGDESGLSILKSIKIINPDINFIMITGYGSIDTAVEAMREGAIDFIEKPVRRHNILKVVEKAFENIKLLKENRLLKMKLEESVSEDHPQPENPDSLHFKIGVTLKEIENYAIKKTIEYSKGNREIASQILGIGLNTLIRKISEMENSQKNQK